MERTKTTKKIEAKMFRCKNCERRYNRELKQMEENEPATRKQEAELNRLMRKAEKGLLCSDCFRTFKKADNKYDVTLLK